MYDRKTWVVVTLCSLLIGANIYFSNQQKAAYDAAHPQEAAAAKAATATVATAPTPAVAITPPTEPPVASAQEETVVLETPEVRFTLTNIGGGIKLAEFKNQLQTGSKTAMVQVNHYGSGPIGALAAAGDTLENLPYAYKADESVPGTKAVYIAKLPSGLIAKKTFALKTDTEAKKAGAPYLLDLQLQLENTTPAPLSMSQWSLFFGEATPHDPLEISTYTGFFWRNEKDINFKSGSSFKGSWSSSAVDRLASPADQKINYAGVNNQFFITLIRPQEPALATVWGRSTPVTLPTATVPTHSIRAGLTLPALTLTTGAPQTLSYLIFVGPKDNTLLQKMNTSWGTGWGETIDYGWFTWVARGLNSVLNFYHRLIDGLAKKWSWGLAVILLTITVRLVLWIPLAKSTRTMKRMAKLQPEMAKIKEKYADDPAKVNTETMGLYKKYGINPLGGCLPMFFQIPVFVAFFNMLRYAVELRGQSFLWIHDLSQPDTLTTLHLPFALPLIGTHLPINILPIIMAISSFLQMRMTPMTGDKMQQNMMKFMPLMFFFFCYNYAAALALYWTTQNIFGIGQTWLMNKVPEPELKALAGGATKKSFIQRMAEKQMEIQKNQKSGGKMRDVTPESKKPRSPRTGG
jgi:YidC/Oxa1 family membrane protein insertase